MKKYFILIVVFAGMYFPAYSLMDFGFTVGFSTPNSNINDVWNSSKISTKDSVVRDLFRDAASAGYNLGIRLRFPLSSNFTFVGGLAYHRFPQSDMELKLVGNDSIVTNLKTTQSLIPITFGLNMYLLRSTLGIYGVGDLSYNYILNDVQYKGVPIDASTSPSDSRVGFGLGLGFDLDLKLITTNLEVKYNISNLIGKTSNEKSKSYLSVNLGIFFGNSKPESKKSDD